MQGNIAMADAETSPEYVAYQLLMYIAVTEKKATSRDSDIEADRKWILDTYAECLQTVISTRD